MNIEEDAGAMVGVASKRFRIDRVDLAVFSLFILLAFVVRVPSFFQSVLGWDEGVWLLMARSMIAGQPPYIQVWDHKPPGLHLLFALAQIFLGSSILSIRILACLAIAITCHLLYLIGKEISKEAKIGLLAGILYTIFSLNNEGLAASAEIFYAPFITLTFYLFFTIYSVKPVNNSAVKLLLIGLVIGIGLQIQYVVIFDFIALLLILSTVIYLQHQESWSNFLTTLFISYGLLVIGPALLFFVVAFYFTLNAHFQDYLYANFLANIIYTSNFDFSPVDMMSVFRQQLANNALLWVCLWLTPFYLVYSKNLDWEEKWRIVALLIWSLMALLAIGSTGRFYSHYFLHLLPPASLLGAYLIISVVYAALPTTRKTQSLLLSLILLGPLLQNLYPTLEMSGALIYFRYVQGVENWGNEPVAIAQYLRKRVYADDYIYAVDYAPSIYYLVPSRTPTKYVFPFHLIDEQNSKITGIDPIQELASIIEKKPIYIIKQYQNDNRFYNELDLYLEEYYVLEHSVNHVNLYRLRNDLE